MKVSKEQFIKELEDTIGVHPLPESVLSTITPCVCGSADCLGWRCNPDAIVHAVLDARGVK